MEKLKSILIIDDDKAYAEGLAAYARHSSVFDEAEYALDGEEGFKIALLTEPDVVVLDAIMPKLDGLGFLRKLKQSNLKRPIVIMNSYSQLSGLFGTAAEYGISYFMIKPQSYDSICSTAAELLAVPQPAPAPEPKEEDKLKISVTRYLKNLGVPAHLSGYRYLRSAIAMTIEDASMMSQVTKRLYPDVAAEYETTPSRVERAIRHAVSVSWKRGNRKLLSDVFGVSPDCAAFCPTNSEYIAMAADDLKLKLRHNAALV